MNLDPQAAAVLAKPGCRFGCNQGIIGVDQHGKTVFCRCVIAALRRQEQDNKKPSKGKGNDGVDSAEGQRVRAILGRIEEAEQKKADYQAQIDSFSELKTKVNNAFTEAEEIQNEYNNIFEDIHDQVEDIHDQVEELQNEAAILILRAKKLSSEADATKDDWSKSSTILDKKCNEFKSIALSLQKRYFASIKIYKRKINEADRLIEKLNQRLEKLNFRKESESGKFE